MEISREDQLEFRLDQMGASQETKDKILSTEKDKEIFFNALFEEDHVPNIKLIALAEDYHQLRKKVDSEEMDVELKVERNANVVADFMDHCKVNGFDLPDSLFETYFGA